METVTYIKRETTDKTGEFLKTRDGRNYTRLVLKVESKGDRYISGFGNPGNSAWGVGDEVDIVITESEKLDKTGKPYLNFSQPKPVDLVNADIEKIKNELVGIKLRLLSVEGKVEGKKDSYPTPESEGLNNDDPYF